MKRTLLLVIPLVIFGLFGHRTPAEAITCTSSQLLFTIISRDAEGRLVPGINFAVVHQNTDPDGRPYVGPTLATGKTDVAGVWELCVRNDVAPYAVKFYEYSPDYGYFVLWQQGIGIPLLEATATGFIAEVRMSNLRVIVRDAEGGLVKRTKFDVYVQAYDVDGSPIVDETKINQAKLVSSNYNTGEAGVVRAYLVAGTYVVRIHGTGNNTYFYLWEQRVTSQAVTELEYRLGTLRVILEDGFGSVLKNRKFSIYQQAYDVRSQAILGTLVASDLDVGTTGKYDAYLPTGTYALKVPSSLGDAFYNVWKISVQNEKLTTRTYNLSGLRIILRDASGALARNVSFSIASQTTDAFGRPVVDRSLISKSTGEVGYSDIFLTPGTYVLVYGTNRLYQLAVFENQFTTVDWPKQITFRPRSGTTVRSPLSNQNISVRALQTASIRGLAGFRTTLGKPVQVRADRVPQPFNVTLSYSAETLKAKSTTANKVRIAFYDARRRAWRYVGRNDPAKRQATAAMRDTGTFVLVAVK